MDRGEDGEEQSREFRVLLLTETGWGGVGNKPEPLLTLQLPGRAADHLYVKIHLRRSSGRRAGTRKSERGSVPSALLSKQKQNTVTTRTAQVE